MPAIKDALTKIRGAHHRVYEDLMAPDEDDDEQLPSKSTASQPQPKAGVLFNPKVAKLGKTLWEKAHAFGFDRVFIP